MMKEFIRPWHHEESHPEEAPLDIKTNRNNKSSIRRQVKMKILGGEGFVQERKVHAYLWHDDDAGNSSSCHHAHNLDRIPN